MDNKQLSTNNANELVHEYRIPDLTDLSAKTVQRLLDTGAVEVFTIDGERLVSLAALEKAKESPSDWYTGIYRFPKVITLASHIKLIEIPLEDGDYSDRAIDAGLNWEVATTQEVHTLLERWRDQWHKRLLVIAPAGFYVEELATQLRDHWERVDITWKLDPQLPAILRDFENQRDKPLRHALIIADDFRFDEERLIDFDVLVLLRPTLSRERLLGTLSPLLSVRDPEGWPDFIIELIGIGEQVRFEDIVDDLELAVAPSCRVQAQI